MDQPIVFNIFFAAFLPSSIYFVLFIVRLSLDVPTQVGTDAIPILIGFDLLVTIGELDIKPILSFDLASASPNRFFLMTSIIGILMMILSVKMERRIYIIRETYSGLTFWNRVSYKCTLAASYLPAVAYAAIHAFVVL